MSFELHQGDLFWVNISFKSKGLHNNPGSDVELEEAVWGGLHLHVAHVYRFANSLLSTFEISLSAT